SNIREVAEPETQWRAGAGDESGKRGIAGDGGNGEPGRTKSQRGRPVESGEHANIGCDAFAAFEPQPDRKEMAEKCPETSGQRWLGAKVPHDQHGSQALEHVAKKCRRSEPPAARAQHIRCADIARTDGADIGG